MKIRIPRDGRPSCSLRFARAAATAILLAAAAIVSGAEAEPDTLRLTPTEQDYLRDHAVLRMCVDPDWMPYEGLDAEGRHVGLVAEYMGLLQQRLGISLRPVPVQSWTETQQFYRTGQCDVVSALNESAERSQYLAFSEPYIRSPAVLVVAAEDQAIKNLADVNGHALAMVEGYIYAAKLRQDYPGIRLVYVASMEQGLQQVAAGEFAATLGPLYLVAESIQRLGLRNLKMIGSTEYRDQLRIGVPKDNLVLLDILNKAIAGLTPEDHSRLKRMRLESEWR